MAKVRSKKTTPRSEYWRGIIAKWETSGQTQAEFCRERDLSLPSFGWWKWELARRDRENSQPKLLPVRVIGTVEPQERETDQLEVVLRQGYRVCVPENFSADALRRLITALEEMSC